MSNLILPYAGQIIVIAIVFLFFFGVGMYALKEQNKIVNKN